MQSNSNVEKIMSKKKYSYSEYKERFSNLKKQGKVKNKASHNYSFLDS